MPLVLVVDDEPAIRQLVAYNLTHAGYAVLEAENGADVLSSVQEHKPDLIILDLMLPGMGGMEVCQQLRRHNVSTPIIMLTARDDEIDRVLGLEIGADDYVTKPFSPRELVARVRAVLRRATAEAQEEHSAATAEIGDIHIDYDKYEVRVRQQPVELTTREFELLAYLCQHPNQVLRRDQLLEKVWGYDFAGDTRIVDVHISHLREKIERDPKSPQYIKTVRGVGYKLVKGDPRGAKNSP